MLLTHVQNISKNRPRGGGGDEGNDLFRHILSYITSYPPTSFFADSRFEELLCPLLF
jgi:hypothetical protein